MTPPVQGDACPDVSTNTKLKDLIQECIGVVGVEDSSRLLSALKSIRNIKIRLGMFSF